LLLQLRYPPLRPLQLIKQVSDDTARLFHRGNLRHCYRGGAHQFGDLILTPIKMFKRN
jgi:hypothetical protein